MEIGIVGKPNVGKSTFFSAATKSQAEIASYPFTTIEANRGVMYVRASCPCKEFNTKCNPKNSQCIEGTRLIPIEAIDVAGLVPDAHKGKGLGNKFLDNLRQADALIHIVDASGGTDFEGRPCRVGTHNPLDDVEFLEMEICYWLLDIIKRDWERIRRQSELENKKIERLLAEKLTGLKINENQIHRAIRNLSLEKPWSEEDLLSLVIELRKISKPMIIALNKCDLIDLDNINELKKKLGERIAIPTSAEAELALKRAAEKDFIEYLSGSSSFDIKKEPAEKQRNALDYIKRRVLEPFGSTGIQECVERAVFDLLKLIVVYPVEDEGHLTDKQGNVLPDALLLPEGSTARELAYKIHTDLGEGFIRAIDARTHRTIGADHKLKSGDIIKIVAKT
jgi:hypothetical protein